MELKKREIWEMKRREWKYIFKKIKGKNDRKKSKEGW